MEMTDKKPRYTWKWRSLVSFYLLFAGIVVLVSGVVLYVSPPGRVGQITGWHLLGLDKEQWSAAHTLSCFMCAIFSVVHLLLNWKILIRYLRNRANRTYQLRAELIVAALLTVVVFVGSAMALPPFSMVMDVGEAFTESWDTGIVASVPSENPESSDAVSTESSDEVSTESSDEVSTESSDEVSDGGWGRFTVEELCSQEGLSVEDGVAYLADYGIDANASSRIRTLADANGYAPGDVVDIISGLAPGTTEAAHATD